MFTKDVGVKKNRRSVPLILVVLVLWGAQVSAELLHGNGVVVTQEQILGEALQLPYDVRSNILSSDTALRDYVDQTYDDLMIEKLAQEQGIAKKQEIVHKIDLMKRKILVQAFMQEMRLAIQVPDFTDLARLYYRGFKRKYSQESKPQVRHILLKISSTDCFGEVEKKAQQLLARLHSGEPFEELAKTYSEDAGSAPKGGDLGEIAKGKTVPAFEKAAYDLENIGDLSGLVRSRFGIHIIQLTGRTEQKTSSFDEVKTRIVKHLTKVYVGNEMSRRKRELLGYENVEVNHQALDEFVARTSKEYKNKAYGEL
jgi:peptidyl-prolyl cis-trans isomerase C